MKKIIILIFTLLIFMPNIKASYVIMDQDTHDVIEENNMHEKRLIASITKVMTAYIVIKSVNLDEVVTVGDEILTTHGSSIYLKKGETLTVEDLLYGMMLRSGNDAAVVLAGYVGGSVENFVRMMNKEAKKINMMNTTFYNPTGLDDNEQGNISTAYDMAILTSKAMKNKTFKKIFKTKKYKCKTNINTHIWYNKNKALTMYKSVTGGKTGYTKKAKRTLITTASNNNINIIIVTLNMSDDFSYHVNKYKNIFNEYEKVTVLNKSNINISDSYFKSRGCDFYIKDNYSLLIKKSQFNDLYLEYIINSNIKPKNNIIIGSIKLYKKNKGIYEIPLYLKCKKKAYI